MEDVEVTTAGIRETVDVSKADDLRWSRAYTVWSETDADWASEDPSSLTSEGRSQRRGWVIVCFAVLFTAIVAGIVVAVVVPSNNKDRSTNIAANIVSETPPPTTTAPSAAPPGLPEECVPSFNNVGYCLKNELSVEEEYSCVDCVWEFLPKDTEATSAAACQQMEVNICHVLSQCSCGPCTNLLEEYLDCQSGCEFDCQLDSATARVQENSGG